MTIKFNLIIIMLFLMGNLFAVNVDYITTIDISNVKNIEKIFAYNEQLFIALSDNSLNRYDIDYDEVRIEKNKSITSSSSYFNNVEDVYITDEIIYILDESYVYKYNYIDRKELFKGDGDSYFPNVPYSLTIANNGTYIYLVDEDKISIMKEYTENKYLSEGAISVSSHGVNAQFSKIVDIVTYDNLFYVLDQGAQKIWVYENTEPYTYVNVLGKGRTGYYMDRASKIEVDNEFIYILENDKHNITLIDRNTGEKIESISFECSDGAEDFAYDNNKLYVLCSEKGDLEIYEVDKRVTKTKEQVETLYNKLYQEISISCELYNASFYFDVTIQNKCEYFMNQIKNYTYENNNDAYEELDKLYAIVQGYNSGTKPILNNKIEKNVSYYMTKMNEGIPYTGAKNYTATRIIWDLQEVLSKKNKGEYLNAISTLKIAISRYNDFVHVVKESENETNEEEIEEEEIVSEYDKLVKEFNTQKKRMENYSYFDLKVIELEGKFLENLSVSELKNELNKLVSEFTEYKENYDLTQSKIEQIEIEYENIKGKLFVDISSIDAQVTCAKANLELNPKEALTCAENALNLITNEGKKSEDNLFIGIFVMGLFSVGIIVLILVGIGIYKYINKNKKRK